MSNPTQTIRLDPSDNAIVALHEIPEGQGCSREGITAREMIPAGHKMATASFSKDDPIIKYKQIIGFASKTIDVGDHIHTHNCDFRNFARDHQFGVDAKETEFVSKQDQATFMGYRRASGQIGTRNYIGLLSSVNCSATVVKQIANRVNHSGILEQYPNVDGVVALSHGSGCCMDPNDEGFANLQRIMSGYAGHANFAATGMIGLGCEVFQVAAFRESSGFDESETFFSLVMQETGGTRRTIEKGVRKIEEILPKANACKREEFPVSELTIALQCGGSDGYSGITANPAMGAAADILIRHGGSVILAETPEIYGAEHLLTRRAASPEIGQKLVDRIIWWEGYTQRNGGVMDNNPTPGHKAGGLTTILEKSLGAAAKGGTTNLNGVYKYAEAIDAKGFLFMDSPGSDMVSITGEVASGANLVCFSTGRGSCFGFKPAPSVKLATNSAMYERLEEDMDLNCGDIVEGACSVEEKGQQIFELWVDVASGKLSKSEELGYGDHEFVPWQIGTVM